MKPLIPVLSMGIAFAITIQTHGGIIPISETYTISGRIWITLTPTFDVSSPSPVFLSDILSSPYTPEDQTFATGGFGASSAFANVSVHSTVQGQSITELDWRPSESGILDLGLTTLRKGGDSFWRVLIDDLTSTTTLLEAVYGLGGYSGEYHTSALQAPVDSTHNYRLTATAYGLGGDTASIFAAFSVHAVPDTCASGLLLGMAMLGLGAVRRFTS